MLEVTHDGMQTRSCLVDYEVIEESIQNSKDGNRIRARVQKVHKTSRPFQTCEQEKLLASEISSSLGGTHQAQSRRDTLCFYTRSLCIHLSYLFWHAMAFETTSAHVAICFGCTFLLVRIQRAFLFSACFAI